MKILILGINQGRRYNWGHQHFKDEVGRQSNARFYGKGHKFWDSNCVDIRSILRRLQFKPDIILTYMGKYCRWVEGLNEISIPKVHIVIDCFPWNANEEISFVRENKIDLTFAVCRHEVRVLTANGIRAKHLPFGVDTGIFNCDEEVRPVDVMAVFSVVGWAYPTRSSILDKLSEMDIMKVARASWPKTRLFHTDYVHALCSSKISINGVDRMQSLNWKFMEPCSCGALLLTEAAEDMEILGYEDGVNCAVFSGMSDMRRKVMHYLNNDKERVSIARAGRDLVRGKHSLVNRVGEMIWMVEKEFGIEDSQRESKGYRKPVS